MSLLPKRPTTPARAAASRANGSKSRGPRTLRGKYNSSLNGLRHGLHAQIHILPGERPEIFEELFHDFHEDLRPSTPVQRALVEKLVMSWWKNQRVWGLESARIHEEIGKGTASGAIPADAHPAIRSALAVAEILKQDRSLELFSRAEARYERQFHRGLKQLLELKSLPPDFDSRNEGSDGDNPGPAPILVMPDPPHPPPTTPQFIPRRDREGVVTPGAKTSPQTPESSETTPPVPQVLTRQPRHAARRLSRPHRPQHRHREHFGRANTYLIQRSPLLAQGDSEGDVAIGHGV